MNILWPVIFALLAQTGTTASVEGIVVKLGSGEPLARATVALWNDKNWAAVLRVTTGADGRFTISNIQPGEYRLMASHSGPYMPADYGQSKPARRGTLITFAAGQKITGVQLALAPTSSISGRILDSDGEPLGRVKVQALQSVYQDGRTVLKMFQSIMTNDLGEYRLHLLPPGRYYISGRAENPNVQNGAFFVRNPNSIPMFYKEAVTPYVSHRVLENGEIEEFIDVPVYFPGTIDSEMATPLEVHIGENPSGLDFTIASGHLRARRIRGRVINGATGQPLAGASVEVVPRMTDSIVFLPAVAQSADDGSFEITGVAGGSYFLLAAIYPPRQMGNPLMNSGIASGRFSIDVGTNDLENVTVVVVPNFTISVQMLVEGRYDYPLPPSVRLVGDPDITGYGAPFTSMKPLAPDGTATISGVGPGDYRLALSGAGYLKSARLGSSDILGDGLHLDRQPEDRLEVVVGTDTGLLAGRVIDDRQQPVSNAFVVLVPPPGLRQRTNPYTISETDASGVFGIGNIVPGDYKLFAWDDIEPGAWQDPEILRMYENQGKPISVGAGSKQNIEVSLIQ